MDYFNEKERINQQSFSKWRDKFLNPLINIMITMKINPNHVTILGVVFLIIACILPSQYYIIIALSLLLYCIIDGIDGPLARHMGKAHQGGAIIDICADQAGVVLISAACVYHIGAFGVFAILFSCSYLAFISLAIHANSHKIALWGAVRIKYFFYFIYIISLYINYDLTSYLMAVFSCYYSIYIIHGLHKIYQHYEKLNGVN